MVSSFTFIIKTRHTYRRMCGKHGPAQRLPSGSCCPGVPHEHCTHVVCSSKCVFTHSCHITLCQTLASPSVQVTSVLTNDVAILPWPSSLLRALVQAEAPRVVGTRGQDSPGAQLHFPPVNRRMAAPALPGERGRCWGPLRPPVSHSHQALLPTQLAPAVFFHVCNYE